MREEGRAGEKEGEREMDSISLFTLKMTISLGLEQTNARNQELHLGLPHRYSGPSSWTVFSCSPSVLTGSCIRRETVGFELIHIGCRHCRY